LNFYTPETKLGYGYEQMKNVIEEAKELDKAFEEDDKAWKTYVVLIDCDDEEE